MGQTFFGAVHPGENSDYFVLAPSTQKPLIFFQGNQGFCRLPKYCVAAQLSAWGICSPVYSCRSIAPGHFVASVQPDFLPSGSTPPVFAATPSLIFAQFWVFSSTELTQLHENGSHDVKGMNHKIATTAGEVRYVL